MDGRRVDKVLVNKYDTPIAHPKKEKGASQ
jgi:hypothetical protein